MAVAVVVLKDNKDQQKDRKFDRYRIVFFSRLHHSQINFFSSIFDDLLLKTTSGFRSRTFSSVRCREFWRDRRQYSAYELRVLQWFYWSGYSKVVFGVDRPPAVSTFSGPQGDLGWDWDDWHGAKSSFFFFLLLLLYHHFPTPATAYQSVVVMLDHTDRNECNDNHLLRPGDNNTGCSRGDRNPSRNTLPTLGDGTSECVSGVRAPGG